MAAIAISGYGAHRRRAKNRIAAATSRKKISAAHPRNNSAERWASRFPFVYMIDPRKQVLCKVKHLGKTAAEKPKIRCLQGHGFTRRGGRKKSIFALFRARGFPEGRSFSCAVQVICLCHPERT